MPVTVGESCEVCGARATRYYRNIPLCTCQGCREVLIETEYAEIAAQLQDDGKYPSPEHPSSDIDVPYEDTEGFGY